MCQKFNYENHAFSIVTKGESLIEMTVRSLATGQTFSNESVSFTKITKETVYATLCKKETKSLQCMSCLSSGRFRYLDVEPRQLILSFVVTLDFLPQFEESVTLSKVVDVQAMEKISALDIQNEVNELGQILENLKVNGPLILHDRTVSLNGKTEVDSIGVEAGVYLLQLTGVIFTMGGVEVMEVEISQEEKENPILMHMKSNCMTSYGYPYSFIAQIEAKKKTNVRIAMKVTGGSNPNISNHLTSLIPVISGL